MSYLCTYSLVFIIRGGCRQRFCQLASVDLSEFSGNSAKNCVNVEARYGTERGEIDAKMKPVEVSDLCICGFDGKDKAEKVQRSILSEKGGGFECFVSSEEDPPDLRALKPHRNKGMRTIICCLMGAGLIISLHYLLELSTSLGYLLAK